MASPAPPPAGNTSRPGKYRAPRLDTGTIARSDLLERLQHSALNARLSLVCAPAGYGKSTLLAALCAGGQGRYQPVWLTLEEGDNDAHRLFEALVGALRSIPLLWRVPSQALTSQVDGDGQGTRAAIAGLVNALCSYSGERLLLVLDDVHHLEGSPAMSLLDVLIERMPPAVGVVIGTRIEPALSLSRWRLRGELGELGMVDLQFAPNEVFTLARECLRTEPDTALMISLMAHTAGWPVGLKLMLHSMQSQPDAASPAGGAARRHLFEHLAREVLEQMRPELREFALQVCVLPELTPARCEAVSGRGDAASLLAELERQQLFLVPLQGEVATLRFHDLFRDFLSEELRRRHPHLPAALHALAATAETDRNRAIDHWIKAGCWQDALDLMLDGAIDLLARGGCSQIEHWLRLLPTALLLGSPESAFLQAVCAWQHWDWQAARPLLERAWRGFVAAGTQARHARTLSMLGGCCNGMGELEAAAMVLRQADALPMAPIARLSFDVLHAWHALSMGEPAEAVSWLHKAADRLLRLAPADAQPSVAYPDIYDISHGHFVGIPGAAAPLKRMRDWFESRRRRVDCHWSDAVVAQGAWLAFWHGEHRQAQAALASQRLLQQYLPEALPLSLSSLHLLSLQRAAEGRLDEALQSAQSLLALLDSPRAGTLRASWGQAYLHVQARIHWMAGDASALAGLLPQLQRRTDREWPVMRQGLTLVQGQVALLQGRLEEAAEALGQATVQHQRLRLPSFIGDPRLSIARLHLQCGRTEAALACLHPVLDEALAEDAIGAFLLEPRSVSDALLGLLCASGRQTAAWQALHHRLRDWQPSPGHTDLAAADATCLSARERQVLQLLAEGQSNRAIAAQLGLSLHTVKRHVVNILGKTRSHSRAQAAHWLSAQPRRP